MTAALPMYDRPETEAANQRFWSAIREALLRVWAEDPRRGWHLPVHLSQVEDLWAHWTAPDLAFSQTCGLPFRTRLQPDVTLIGTPDYGLPDCPAGHYNSVFVMRAGEASDDPTGWPRLRLAANSSSSQSGWAAPQNWMRDRGLAFTEVVLTGGHRVSARAVAGGHADIACIDAQTWRMIRRWDGVASELAEVGRTDPTPGLPFITATRRDPTDIARAAEEAIAALSDADRRALDLRGIVQIPADRYLEVPTPPFPAANARRIG